MKIVWQLEKATVRDVYEELLERRKIAYTTVMTMMKMLEQKQYLKKTLEDSAPTYIAHAPQEPGDPRHGREFVDRVFNGSAQLLRIWSRTGV